MITDTGDEEPTARVVVGVDGSEHSARAARWAAGEAQARGAALTVVHALHLPTGAALPLEPPQYAAKARAHGGELLGAVAGTLRAEFPKLEIHTELSDLAPAQTLSTLSLEAVLVVTGSRGHGGFTGMLTGSVSRKLAAHAHSPLVVVRGEEPEGAQNAVVVGIAPGEPVAPVRYAFAAAQRHGATLRAVRAWYPYSTYSGPAGTYFPDFDEVREDERRAVQHLLAPLRTSFPDVTVEISSERGNPVPTLIEAARGARLLVVGAHRHHGPLAVGAGYVVDGLLAHSPTPVAVVPIH
jgi:nucleotide-binding universal stress UspA family protein